MDALLDSLYGNYVAGLQTGRNKTAEQVQAMIDNGPYDGQQALKAGLVDELVYDDQLRERLKEGTALAPGKYARQSRGFGFDHRPKVALVYAVGDIIPGESQGGPFGGQFAGSDTVAKALRQARKDSDIKAIVLRVDSPGGSVLASEEIYREVRAAQRNGKPVIVSMGDLAASGGYYIACAGDRIVAHPTTVTGSIGVILMNLNLEGLLGKIGVRNETYKAGAHKDLLSPLRGATPEERRIIQAVLDTMHARFISVVRESRPGLDPARVPELTDGRIFDAPQAVAAGLVDEIGDLRRAIALAERAAGIEKARVVMYHRRDDSKENIYSGGGGLPAQVNLMPVDLGVLAGRGPRFMYLWAPGLGL